MACHWIELAIEIWIKNGDGLLAAKFIDSTQSSWWPAAYVKSIMACRIVDVSIWLAMESRDIEEVLHFSIQFIESNSTLGKLNQSN